jgi:hypothetical protein
MALPDTAVVSQEEADSPELHRNNVGRTANVGVFVGRAPGSDGIPAMTTAKLDLSVIAHDDVQMCAGCWCSAVACGGLDGVMSEYALLVEPRMRVWRIEFKIPCRCMYLRASGCLREGGEVLGAKYVQ